MANLVQGPLTDRQEVIRPQKEGSGLTGVTGRKRCRSEWDQRICNTQRHSPKTCLYPSFPASLRLCVSPPAFPLYSFSPLA